jgi:hypothetical protein
MSSSLTAREAAPLLGLASASQAHRALQKAGCPFTLDRSKAGIPTKLYDYAGVMEERERRMKVFAPTVAP